MVVGESISKGGRYFSLSAYLAFGLFLFGTKLFLIHAYGNGTPFWDQWDAEAENLYKPFLEGTLQLRDLFLPHNEHRIFTTRILALGLLLINGIWSPLLQMLVNATLHVFVICIYIYLLIRVVGNCYLPAILFFSLVLFGLPYAWENTLAGFQSQFYFVMLFSIAFLWLVVNSKPFSTRWWAGVLCAVLAFLSLASGVFSIAAATTISILFFILKLRKTGEQMFSIAVLSGMFALCVAVTPSLAPHEALKAHSFYQFFVAFLSVLRWPILSGQDLSTSLCLLLAIIRNLPAFYFLGLMLIKRPPSNDRKWFLLALVIWSIGQSVSIAYGRAVGNLASRYLDLFAVAILVNLTCLISLTQFEKGAQGALKRIAIVAWPIMILLFLGQFVLTYTPSELASKRDTGLAQELNTRNYIETNDFGYLADKLSLNIPYPDPKRLALILSTPDIRSVLPPNIRGKLKYSKIIRGSADAFVVNGYYPTTPKREEGAIGSYGGMGNGETGVADLYFENNTVNGFAEIPISGYPSRDGVNIEVQQNGDRYLIHPSKDPGESWELFYARIKPGPFSIHLSDQSTSAWVAIGAISTLGRLDVLVKFLLTNCLVFIVAGCIIVLVLLLQYGLLSCANYKDQQK